MSATRTGSWYLASRGAKVGTIALVAGIVVASVIVLPTLFAHSPASTPQPAPLFSYLANTTIVSSVPGSYVYNVTITALLGVNVSASTTWTQFWGGTRLLVSLVTSEGMVVAHYNSSNSSFRGPGTGLNETTFPNLGGWGPGYGVAVVVGDTFVVHSAGSLSGANLWLYMASAAPPHWFNGQSLLS
jgi:hypothetical protein